MDPTAPPLIDWVGHVCLASLEGELMGFLQTLPPPTRWAEREDDGETFLHHAARGNNVGAAVALLQSGLVDVDAVSRAGRTAATVAASNGQARVLEVLCAAGANLGRIDGEAPLDAAVWWGRSLVAVLDCAALLMANGVRLRTVCDPYASAISPCMWTLERGLLRCRAAVVVLLGLKRRRGDVMRTLDRWVVREIAWAVWATRADVKWHL